MTSLLSAISGQFTRSLILGTFFPIVLFTMLGLAALEPLLPRGIPVIRAFAALDPKWEILAVTFFVIIATGFLYNLNIPIVRLFEGYPWRQSAIGQWRVSRHTDTFNRLQTAIPRLRTLRDSWRKVDPKVPVLKEIEKKYRELYLAARNGYPSRADLILPTRFGNVVRNFETYPSEQYGIDAVVFWPRLAAVAQKDYLAGVDDARSMVDFFVNCATLSLLLAALVLGIGVSVTGPQMPFSTLIRWPLETLAALVAGYLFYLGAVSRAAEWGATVKGAFDLYRWDLLKKLGYDLTPAMRQRERQLWQAISQQTIYGDPPFNPPIDYSREMRRTVVTTEPADLGVTVSAAVEPGAGNEMRFIYRIENNDTNRRCGTKVTLAETLPAEFGLVWKSARANGKPCQVTGIKPLVFELGPLAHGSAIEVEYAALPLERQHK